MLRGHSGLCPLRVRPHVSLLPGQGLIFLKTFSPHLIISPVRAAAVEGPGRGNMPHVPGANPGCHQDLQVRRLMILCKNIIILSPGLSAQSNKQLLHRQLL